MRGEAILGKLLRDLRKAGISPIEVTAVDFFSNNGEGALRRI